MGPLPGSENPVQRAGWLRLRTRTDVTTLRSSPSARPLRGLCAMKIRTYSQLSGTDRSDLAGQLRDQADRVRRRLEAVRHVVAVTSGKGGVGKSLTAAAVAAASRIAGLQVGLLDADLNGPTATRFLGGDGRPLRIRDGVVVPARGETGVAYISMGLLLADGAPLEWREPAAESFVWRGAQERGAVREFLADVEWGSLDLLVIDLPPGGQRLLELAELVPELTGAVAVTLPSAASRTSVGRSLELARGRGIRILGVVENMAGYVCEGCGALGTLFPGDAGRRLADRFETPLLGRIPFDASAGAAAESGQIAELLETAAGRAWRSVAEDLIGRLGAGDPASVDSDADRAQREGE